MADPIRFGGMNSGLDTEAIIEAMMSTYQTKIDNQNKKLTTLTWKQEAYQSIAEKMTAFQNKYFDILKKDSYLMSASTFNKFKSDVSSTGTNTKGLTVTTTGNSTPATHKLTINSTATATKVKGAEITPDNFKLDADKALQSVGYTDDGNTRTYDFSMNVKVGGVTKTINFSAEGQIGADGNVDMDALKQNMLDSMNEKLQAGFGYTGNTSGTGEGVIDAANGNEWFLQAELADDGSFEFVVGGNATVSVTENVGNFGLSDAASSASLSLTSVVTGTNTMSIDAGGVIKNVRFEGVSGSYYDSKSEDGNEAILEEYNKLKEAAFRKENNLSETDDIDEEALKKFSYSNEQAAKDKNAAAITDAVNNAFASEGITAEFSGSTLSLKKGDAAVDFTSHAIEGGTLGLAKSSASNKLSAKTTLEDMGIAANGADGGYTMKINGVEISVGADATIDTLVNAVNKSGAGVKLSFSSLTNSFSVESNELGSAGAVEIEGSDMTKALGLTDDSGDMVGFQFGQNASITLDGEEIYLNENTYTLDGTTFSFTDEVELGETYTIGITQNYDDVKKTIKNFVEDYNKLIDDVYEYIGSKPKTDSSNNKYEPLTDAQKEEMSEDEIEKWEEMAKVGVLYNDSTVASIMSKMRGIMYNSVTLDDGSKIGLYSLGIKTSDDYGDHGKLEIDEERLDAMFQSDPEAITKLFTDPENGLMKQLDAALDSAVKTSGAESNRGTLIRKAGYKDSSTTLQSSIFKEMERLTDRLYDLQDRYDAREEYWWSVFTNLESMMSDMNSQSAYMASYQF